MRAAAHRGARGETCLRAQDIITTLMLTEAAANFDFWQRSGAAETNRRQDFWPPLLRLARLIPSVEYVQARAARGRPLCSLCTIAMFVEWQCMPCICKAAVRAMHSLWWP